MRAINPLVQLGLIVVALVSASGTYGDDRNIQSAGYNWRILELGHGDPIVVFENGMGEDLSTWKDVQPEVAKLTRTFAYDRAGLGKSGRSPSPHLRDAKQLAEELKTLLQTAKMQGPYILVGHSLGGAIVQVFAAEYPSEVAGLVLVDPGDGRLDKLLKERLPTDIWLARQRALSQELPMLPEPIRKEYEGLGASGEEAEQAFPLPPVPIILLTGTKKNPDFPGNPLEQDLKLEMHNKLAARTSGIEHVLVSGSRHYIQNDDPKQVISAIARVLALARTRR